MPWQPAISLAYEEQVHRGVEGLAVQRHRLAFLEAHGHFLGQDLTVLAPEGHAHDRVDDADARVQVLQVLGLVGGAQHVAVGAVGLLDRHLVVEAVLDEELAHLLAAAELVDEGLVQPGLVDLQARVGEQAVAVEALDVVALEGGAIAPDVDVVLLHGGHQHGAGDGAAQRRGVEVGDAAGADVEGTALQGGDAFVGELAAAVHQTGLLGTKAHGLARNLVVVGFVRLAKVGGVGVGHRALLFHPQQRGRGVQAAGEGDADFLPLGQVLQDGAHGRLGRWISRSGRCSGRPRSHECRSCCCRGC